MPARRTTRQRSTPARRSGAGSAKGTPARQGQRLAVAKTWKLYIGGSFPRSESGRSIPVTHVATGELAANVAWASRKDAREAVRAARGAVGSWSAATAYNRGQVLYRIAEMLEGRRGQFEHELGLRGATAAQARTEVDAAIDAWVYYAGFADKYQQVLGTVNPVAAPYFNFTLHEPMGVVAVACPDDGPLVEVARLTAPLLAAGNTVVVVAGEDNPLVAMTFAEVLATSDVPAGAVNILTGYRGELMPVLAAHMDVNGLELAGVPEADRAELERLGIGSLKRTWASDGDARRPGIGPIERGTEAKTIWHPVGV